MLAEGPVHTAVVAKTDVATHAERYLLAPTGAQPVWVEKPEQATVFASMREAMRMAMRLPASLRAYGLPRDAELAVTH